MINYKWKDLGPSQAHLEPESSGEEGGARCLLCQLLLSHIPGR